MIATLCEIFIVVYIAFAESLMVCFVDLVHKKYSPGLDAFSISEYYYYKNLEYDFCSCKSAAYSSLLSISSTVVWGYFFLGCPVLFPFALFRYILHLFTPVERTVL